MGGCLSSRGRRSKKSSPWAPAGSQRGRKKKRSVLQKVITFHQLASVPSRVVGNGRSKSSCIFTQQGRKGINQDALIVWEDFLSAETVFCGVFDGHGPYGHLVAQRVRDALPLKLMSFMQSHGMNEIGRRNNCFKLKRDASNPVCSAKEIISEDSLISLWRDCFLKSFTSMDKELRSHPSIDCFCSGSTAVALVKQGSNLFIGNIGDSRAVMGSNSDSGSLIAIQLTVDLKPDLPREAERIKRCKGRVFSLQDEPEVQRVWLPFDDAPGLAMARAFGDFCLKDYGLISIPDFSHRKLTEKDQFIVLASDGVWDVLSNEEVVNIVSSSPTRSSAARILVNSAVHEWKVKYPTSKMDDCAVVCLYLDAEMDCESEMDEPSVSAAYHSQTNESDDGLMPEPCLMRNFTVRATTREHNLKDRTPVSIEGNRTLAAVEDQNWLGLEGLTRVNSLVQLPRFSEESENV